MAKEVQVIRATKYLDEQDVIRVGAYCRVSSDHKDQINSFLAQVQYYTEYIRSNDRMRLVDIYADEGITGTEMKKREEFMRMLKDAKNGKLDRILVKSIFRFARNSLDCIEAIRELKNNGVSVYFENDKIDTDKMNSEMMLYIKSAFAQSEALNHSRRMATSVRMKMENGTYCPGIVPYGYRLVDKEMIIVPEEAEKIKTIFRLYLSGIGSTAIVKYMQRHEDTDMVWTRGRVQYILNNERYCGDFMMHKTYTPNVLPLRSRRNRGEEDRYFVENANPAIISREDFQAAKRIMESRTDKYLKSDGKKKPFFTGKIRCRKCGWIFHTMCGVSTETWCCTKMGKAIDICHAPKVRTEEFENAFLRMFNVLQANRKKLIDEPINLLSSLKVKCNLGNNELAEIDGDLATLSTQNRAYAEMLAAGNIDQVTYSEKSDRIKKKITELRSRRLKLLSADEEERCIEELRVLARVLERQPQAITEFSPELYDEIIDVLYVEQDGSFTFKLKGGLELKVRR